MLYSILEALNDDDSEIRDLAASTVSYILWNETREHPPSMTSITAHRLLFQYITRQGTDGLDSSGYGLGCVLGLPKVMAASLDVSPIN